MTTGLLSNRQKLRRASPRTPCAVVLFRAMTTQKDIRGIDWSPKIIDGWPIWRIFIYTLTDPFTSEICYVGQTDDVEKRYAQHIKNRHTTILKGRWMNNLTVTLKRNPIMTVIESVEPLEADRAELAAIYRYWDEGSPLLNRLSEKRIPPCVYNARIAASRIQTDYRFINPDWLRHLIEGCGHCINIRFYVRKWLDHAYEQGRKARRSGKRLLITSPY